MNTFIKNTVDGAEKITSEKKREML